MSFAPTNFDKGLSEHLIRKPYYNGTFPPLALCYLWGNIIHLLEKYGIFKLKHINLFLN